jgi:multisubunit Na+/H+ antiporter MnhC subunit
MKRLPKYFSFLSMLVGLVLFMGSDDRYFYKSGAVGAVTIMIGSLIFVLQLINRQRAEPLFRISILTKLGIGMATTGALMLAVGFKFSTSVWAITTAQVGYPLVFMGIIITAIGSLRK